MPAGYLGDRKTSTSGTSVKNLHLRGYQEDHPDDDRPDAVQNCPGRGGDVLGDVHPGEVEEGDGEHGEDEPGEEGGVVAQLGRSLGDTEAASED